MATEEDNFDIDIYGDGIDDYQQVASEEEINKTENPPSEPAINHSDAAAGVASIPDGVHLSASETDVQQDVDLEKDRLPTNDVAQKIASTDDSAQDSLHLPKQAPQAQGLKRKDGYDDRYLDPGATTALFISDLHWWITDDDIRGWANQSQCEDELEDVTFSEHKVNGKSKGQAYILFKSPQAATATKQKVESFGQGQQYTKKFSVSYTNPFTNPFRTLPKDGPMRNNNAANNRSVPGYSAQGPMGSQQMGYNPSNAYRNTRGGYNPRGGVNSTSNYNRGGFQQTMSGGFHGGTPGGFQSNPMGGMQPYGTFQNRGGMMGGIRGGAMGMRGGRGGMGSNGMMGLPMGSMGMGMGMGSQMGGMGMGMPQMGAGMGMQGTQKALSLSLLL
ncbi:MAG: hypothetical protein LQ351_006848 [Letrouitia transgressa]|nr:MAG: hypothetical protein LQ351_006848 [Letrouitia transgressa]